MLEPAREPATSTSRPTITVGLILAALLLLLLLGAKGPGPDGGGAPPSPDAGASPRQGACPPDMARVADSCIDRFEASLETRAGAGGRGEARAVSRKGLLPAAKVPFESARRACLASGKRLCRRDEWMTACRGPLQDRRYPYGAQYDEQRCMGWGTRDPKKKPGPAPSGSFPGCKSLEIDVYDLSGNVFEWIDEPGRGGLRHICGGSFNNAGNDLGCSCSALERPDSKQDAVGFRCCRDLVGGSADQR